MSLRKGAPYADRVEERGRILIYEGHDIPRTREGPNPKDADQPEFSPVGKPTQNGLFWNAVLSHKKNGVPAELVRVYEKIKTGIWAYAGLFELIDAWKDRDFKRTVFKFKLRLSNQQPGTLPSSTDEIEHE
jgi:hypothetical protein